MDLCWQSPNETIFGLLLWLSCKDPPANAGDGVWSMGREDTLEEEMATHSSILAWKIPWTDEPGRLHSKGSQRVGHDWATEHTQWENKQCASQYFGSYGAFFFEPANWYFSWSFYHVCSFPKDAIILQKFRVNFLLRLVRSSWDMGDTVRCYQVQDWEAHS